MTSLPTSIQATGFLLVLQLLSGWNAEHWQSKVPRLSSSYIYRRLYSCYNSGNTMITAVLLCILLTLLLGGVLLSRRRRHNEPPLDRGLIPWLGHALEFGKDAATFLMSMKAKHGDIFTIQVAGKFLTVLLEPHSYENVVWASRSKLDFGIYAKVLMRRMFDVTLPDYDVTAEKGMLRPHLQNEKLCSLTASMRRNLASILNDSSTSASAWREDSLFSFTYGVMLRAGFLTLFGSCELSDSPVEDLRHSKEVYREFRRFDKLLMKTARNALSAAEKKELCLVKENLWQLLDAETLKRRVNRSSWLESYQRHLEELQVPNAMQSRAMLLQLWATQGNAGPAAFWLLLYLMKHPRAMEAVTAELKLTMQGQEEISQRALESATILDSALEESLRMTAAPFITREVLSEGSLRLADGREYLLRRGDRLCLFPYVSPQMDTEIHPEPQEFRYNRFLNGDGTKKREFYKSGRTLAHASLPWGAGSNVCVGRFYATNSIKLFIWLLLLNFEIGLKDPDEKMPEFDESRYGFGVLQPKHDVLFQYRRRRCELFMK